MADRFGFQPLDPEFRRDPYAAYARGRREFPVFLHEGLPLRLASVFRYEDVQSILRDDETWSNHFPVKLKESIRVDPDDDTQSMLFTDGAEHLRLRSLVNKAFTPRMIQRLEPRMREIAHELLDAALEAEEVDLVEVLAYPLPVTVIAEIIGIPAADRARFKLWSDEAVASLGRGFFGDMDLERFESQRRLLKEMRDYFVPLAEERRRAPREDLLTGLVQAEHEGSKLSHDEMLRMLVLLLVAGNETTTTLIGNAALELLGHPRELERLRGDPGLLPSAIDEVLRFSSPVQFAPRRATRSVSLHGVEVEADSVVLAWIGSANRDEKVFEQADVFDVGRLANPHLAFGFGAHYCLGANLARLETRVALAALLDRTRLFERVGEDSLPLHASPVFHAVARLPVRLRA